MVYGRGFGAARVVVGGLLAEPSTPEALPQALRVHVQEPLRLGSCVGRPGPIICRISFDTHVANVPLLQVQCQRQPPAEKNITSTRGKPHTSWRRAAADRHMQPVSEALSFAPSWYQAK